jgi:hypothetical protein
VSADVGSLEGVSLVDASEVDGAVVDVSLVDASFIVFSLLACSIRADGWATKIIAFTQAGVNQNHNRQLQSSG